MLLLTLATLNVSFKELNNVLEERAKNPQYKSFNDKENHLSFEYPSSIALVGKEVNSKSLLYMVYPQIPATINSEFWKGMQIFIEPCIGNCISTLSTYIKSKYAFDKESKIETASTTSKIGEGMWTISKLSNSRGKIITLYSYIKDRHLIVVGTDTENQTANISTAFKRVIETLKY